MHALGFVDHGAEFARRGIVIKNTPKANATRAGEVELYHYLQRLGGPLDKPPRFLQDPTKNDDDPEKYRGYAVFSARKSIVLCQKAINDIRHYQTGVPTAGGDVRVPDWIANIETWSVLSDEDYEARIRVPQEKAPNEVIAREKEALACLLYTSPSPRDRGGSRMPSSA